MTAPDVEKKLAAILAADVAGYTRLMADDERATIDTITNYRQRFRAHIESNGGRVVDMAGDSVLAVFASTDGAVSAAVATQRELGGLNADLPEARRMHFRIGVNLGDIQEAEDGTVYGEGVNIAARLEGLATPGGVMLSEDAWRQVRRNPALTFDDAGAHAVKNVADPVHAYRVLADGEAPTGARKGTPKLLIVAAAVVLAIVGVGWWQFASVSEPPPIEPARVERMAFPLPDEPSIAVLPFDNHSESDAHGYIADGLSENIIATLSQVRGVMVIARNSTFVYKGKPVRIQQVAEDLGVRYVLEGSIQVADERLRVTAQLIDAVSGDHMWSERYERTLDDVFAVQDHITLNVVSALQVQLTEGPHALVWRGGTKSLEAWSLFQRGREHLLRFTPVDIAEARRLFEQAAAIDPNFALAVAQIGNSHRLEATLEISANPQESLDIALGYVEQAAAIDPDSPDVRVVLGLVLRSRHDIEGAIEQVDVAIKLGPNHGYVLAMAAFTLSPLGQADRAVALMERAMRLSPNGLKWYPVVLADSHLLAGCYESALEALRAAEANLLPAWQARVRIAALGGLERYEEARREIAAHVENDKDFSIAIMRDRMEGPFAFAPDAVTTYVALFRAAGVAEQPPGAEPARPSIAVLPFDNLSGDPEQDYFADGMTDTLITDLSKLANLGVIARHSTFTYKGRSVDVREVGAALGATHVLEGSVMRAGGQVRVNVQLIDAQSGEPVWADRFDGPIDDIFAVQDGIVGAVISALDITLVSGEQGRSWRRTTDNPEAYDLFLRAREVQTRRLKADIAAAQVLSQAALDVDPTFAAALFLLGNTHYDQAVAGWSESPHLSMETAEQLFLRAIELDGSLGAAYTHLGLIHLARQDHDQALDYAARGVEFTPGAADTLAMASIVYSYSGKPERGLELIERATQLDPFPQNWFAHVEGVAHLFLGDHEQALARYRACVEELADFIWCKVNIIIPAMELGLIDEARAEARDVLRINPAFDSATAVQVVRIKDPVIRAHWQDLLRQAGLP